MSRRHGRGGDPARFAHPSLDLMKKWLGNGQFHCFRKVCRAGGRSFVEKHSGDLLYFVCCYGEDDNYCMYDIDDDYGGWNYGSVAPRVKKPMEALRFLLEEMRLPLNHYFPEHGSVLLYATANLDTELVELCIRCGADPNATTVIRVSEDGALMQPHIVEPVLNNLIKSELSQHFPMRDMFGVSHLITGAREFSNEKIKAVVAMVELLCDKGAYVNQRSQDEESSPVSVLLSCCKQSRSRDGKGKNLDDVKEIGGHLCPHDRCANEVLEVLLRRGATLPKCYTVTSPDVATPYHVPLPSLLMEGFPSVFWTILKHGGKMSVTDKDRGLLLRCAVSYVGADLLRFLLEKWTGIQPTAHGHLDESHNESASADKHLKSNSAQAEELAKGADDKTSENDCHGKNGLDLWSVAVRRGDLSIFEVLQYASVPATQAALFQSALNTDPALVQFMVDKLSFSADVAGDALKLQSAYCLLELTMSKAKGTILSASHLPILIARHSIASVLSVSTLMQELSTGEDANPAIFSSNYGGRHFNVCRFGDTMTSRQRQNEDYSKKQILATALHSFGQALKYSEGLEDQPPLLRSGIDVAGHEIREARGWDDFKHLAEIEIPTAAPKSALSGLALYALLVVGRTLPKDPFCFKAFQNVASLLVPENVSGFARRQQYGTQPSEDMIPFSYGRECSSEELVAMLGSYALLVYHTGLWKDLTTDELKDLLGNSVKPSRIHARLFIRVEESFPAMRVDEQASNLARWVLSNGMVIDTWPAFRWLCQLLLIMETAAERSSVLRSAVRLLLTMSGYCHQSPVMRTQLSDAVNELVAISLSSSVEESVLHVAVQEVIDEEKENLFTGVMVGADSTDYHMRRRTAGRLVVKALLDTGGPRLVDQVNAKSETAAHVLLDKAAMYMSSTYADTPPGHDQLSTVNFIMELLHIFDDYGQHWDYCYGGKSSLLECLQRYPKLSAFTTMLSSRPVKLRCQAALSAACFSEEVLHRFLPKHMVEFVLNHRRAARQQYNPVRSFRYDDYYDFAEDEDVYDRDGPCGLGYDEYASDCYDERTYLYDDSDCDDWL